MLPRWICKLSAFELKQLKTYVEMNQGNVIIQQSSSPAEAPYTYIQQLVSRAMDNVPDARDSGAAGGYFFEVRAIMETTRFGPRCTNFHIPGMHYCSEIEDKQSFDYCDIHEVM